jgi:hypothetical protein
MRIAGLIFVVLLLNGCTSLFYEETKPGELRGKLIVQWIEHDEFIFEPDRENPLTFTRHDQTMITPQRFYTDGGSIPRPLWAFRSYSPWGYAPAFIMHDWLFDMHQCQLPGHENYDAEEAAWIMAEVMKTMMEENEVLQSDKLVVYTMFEAVRSPIARKLWDNGACELPTDDSIKIRKAPIAEYVLEFP